MYISYLHSYLYPQLVFLCLVIILFYSECVCVDWSISMLDATEVCTYKGKFLHVEKG